MPIELKMPALSPTMEEGTLARWLVKEGDTVKSGDILAEIETDKATMEFEAVDEGTIAKIAVAEGTDGVKVGTVIALIAEEGWSTYGVGAELAARIHRLCFDDLDAPVERVGGAEVPMPYSKPLELAALPLETKIEAAARGLLAESGIA